MNYYIDFDSTLYDTSRLSNDMLNALALEICKYVNSDTEKMMDELKLMFNRDHIYNIYKLAKYFASKYNIEENIMISSVEKVIESRRKVCI